MATVASATPPVEVPRAESHGLHCLVDAAPGGHHDDGKGRVERLQPREQVHTFAAGGGVPGVVEVDQRRVGPVLLHQRDDSLRHVGRDGPVTLCLEQQAQGLQDVGLIIGDEDERGVRHEESIVEECRRGSKRVEERNHSKNGALRPPSTPFDSLRLVFRQ